MQISRKKIVGAFVYTKSYENLITGKYNKCVENKLTEHKT